MGAYERKTGFEFLINVALFDWWDRKGDR